jgi:hypothetical protein
MKQLLLTLLLNKISWIISFETSFLPTQEA